MLVLNAEIRYNGYAVRLINSPYAKGSNDYQYFTKEFRSGDFSRSVAERLKSLLRFRDLLIIDFDMHYNLTPKGWHTVKFMSALRA